MTNDAIRRNEFLAYFDKRYKADRAQFMADTGLSKGRVTQLFDADQSFGERAALNLELTLKLEQGAIFPSLARSTRPASGKSGKHPGVPVVGTAQLGDEGYFCDLNHPVGFGDGVIEWPTKDPNAYALRCKGESMKPRVRHGEYVIVEPNHECVPGDEVLVKAADGRVMVKQLAFSRDGMVHLDSVNESHPRISIPIGEISAIQYVAGIAKSALWSES